MKNDLTKWPVLSTVYAETNKQLHTELAALGLPVLGAPQFGTETEYRVRDFQKLHELPVLGAVDSTTGDVMTLVATVTMASDKDKLQAGFRAGVYESEMYWCECA